MPPSAAIHRFWSWFAANADRFRTMKTDARDDLLEDIETQLHAIDERLFFEVSEPDDGANDFVISADGDAELFPLVDEVIAAAPKLPRWTFTALRPAMGFEFSIRYEDIELDPEELWFMPLTAEGEDDEEHFGLRLGVPGGAALDEETALAACWILLDTGLGERTCADSIEHLEVVDLPENPEEEGYLRLDDLADFLKWRKTQNGS